MPHCCFVAVVDVWSVAWLDSVLVVGTVTAAWYFWKRAGQMVYFAAQSRVISRRYKYLGLSFHFFLCSIKSRELIFYSNFLGFVGVFSHRRGNVLRSFVPVRTYRVCGSSYRYCYHTPSSVRQQWFNSRKSAVPPSIHRSKESVR